MTKEIAIKLSRKSAEELTDVEIKIGLLNPEHREERIKQHLKPQKALFG